jgi:hypothetical protein
MMSVDERTLRERLARLERAMPDALPLDLGEVVAVDRPRPVGGVTAWPASLLLPAAVLAGVLVAVSGLLVLAPRQPGTTVLPSGLYRSATPIQGPVCVALELPIRPAAGGLAQQRVWWWPAGPDGCGQRTDFIYVQWVQPTRMRIAGEDGAGRDGIRLELVVELRDGSRHDLGFALDPMASAAGDGSVPTYRADDGAPSGTLLPINDYDQIQEVAP